jgi:hypothetical protein
MKCRPCTEAKEAQGQEDKNGGREFARHDVLLKDTINVSV